MNMVHIIRLVTFVSMNISGCSMGMAGFLWMPLFVVMTKTENVLFLGIWPTAAYETALSLNIACSGLFNKRNLAYSS